MFMYNNYYCTVNVLRSVKRIRERVQISASGHADADQSGADFFRFRFQSVPILSVPIETESAPFKILHRAN